MSKQQQNVDFNKFVHVCKYGKYAYPATKRYEKKQYNIVICDLCQTNGLKSCYGLDTIDLCIPCVKFILDKMKNNKTSPIIKSFEKKSPDEINLSDKQMKKINEELDKKIINSDNKIINSNERLSALINEDSDTYKDVKDNEEDDFNVD